MTGLALLTTGLRVVPAVALALSVTTLARADSAAPQAGEDPCRPPLRDPRMARACAGLPTEAPPLPRHEDPCLDGRLTPMERAKCRGPLGEPPVRMGPETARRDPDGVVSLLIGRWRFDERLWNANLTGTQVTGSMEFRADGTYAYDAVVGGAVVHEQGGTYQVIDRGARALPLLVLKPSRSTGSRSNVDLLDASGLMGAADKAFPVTVTTNAHRSGWAWYECDGCINYTNFLRMPDAR